MTKLKNIFHSTITLRTLGATLALSLFASVPALAQMQQQNQGQSQGEDPVQEKLQALQSNLQSLNNDIAEVQNEANKAPEIRKALQNYSEVLTAEMIKIDPDNKTLIQERQATYEQILEINNSTEMSAEKESRLQELGQKFNAVRQQLGQTEAQANQTDAASAAMEVYSEKVLSKMTEIDPEINEKIEQREAMSQEFRQLRNAIIQQQ